MRWQKLLDEVESGENLTAERQQQYHEKTKIRDLAMLTLLLGTGIRVSECVGLDLDDVDLKNNGIKIHRKGGAEVVVYFGEEVRRALMDYMVERQKITAADGEYQCALPITSKQAHKCQIRGKYGKKIFQACNNLKTYYAA